MADENNPRPSAFQLADLDEHFERLPRLKSQGHWTVSSRRWQGSWNASDKRISVHCARLTAHIPARLPASAPSVWRRYVSGYLQTLAPANRERLTGADASHAWVSVYCPGTGWIDLDPTNNVVPSTSHITLAWGRDYSDVSPIRGVIQGGGQHELTVAVDVTPINED